MKEQARAIFDQIDRKRATRNAGTSAIVGGIFGTINTVGIVAIFTLVSTNQYMNFYLGGFFMVIGVLVLVRVHKRRGLISTDITANQGASAGGKKNDDGEEDENEGLLLLQEE